jgi:hypothetical protein
MDNKGGGGGMGDGEETNHGWFLPQNTPEKKHSVRENWCCGCMVTRGVQPRRPPQPSIMECTNMLGWTSACALVASSGGLEGGADASRVLRVWVRRVALLCFWSTFF